MCSDHLLRPASSLQPFLKIHSSKDVYCETLLFQQLFAHFLLGDPVAVAVKWQWQFSSTSVAVAEWQGKKSSSCCHLLRTACSLRYPSLPVKSTHIILNPFKMLNAKTLSCSKPWWRIRDGVKNVFTESVCKRYLYVLDTFPILPADTIRNTSF